MHNRRQPSSARFPGLLRDYYRWTFADCMGLIGKDGTKALDFDSLHLNVFSFFFLFQDCTIYCIVTHCFDLFFESQ